MRVCTAAPGELSNAANLTFSVVFDCVSTGVTNINVAFGVGDEGRQDQDTGKKTPSHMTNGEKRREV